MSTSATPRWENKRTQETREIENLLREHFERVDSYRYNSAVIRLRIVDPTFEGKSRENRDSIVEEFINALPDDTQRDIVTLLTFAPSEIDDNSGASAEQMLNSEFDEPSPSTL